MQTDLDKRKKQFLTLIKSKIFYILTAIAIFIGAFIRTRNLPLLKDKLLLALDPYLFYRYTKYILEHGSLMAIDTLRYVPLGYKTKGEAILLSYLVAYFYKIVHVIMPSLTFEKFNILYPVILFIFAAIIFFLLVKKLFNIKIATLATAFLAVLPGFIYRTTAGFSEKEPMGIFFMFLTFYFYILAFNSKKTNKGVFYGLLSGLFSGLLATVWGGVGLVFIIIPTFTLAAFVLNKVHKKEFYTYSAWFITILIIVLLRGYTISLIFSSFTTLISIFVFFALLLDHLIFNLNILKLKEKIERKFPPKVTSLLISLVLAIIATSIIFSPFYFIERALDVIETLIHPMGTSRFVLTVAEAHQPYFTNWKSNYYWFFHMFFIGSILLFYKFVKPLGKHYKWFLTLVYSLFISAFIFSRYSQTSILNGENRISRFLYLGSLFIFVLIILGVKIYTFLKDKETHNKLKNLNTNYIFVFVWFLLTVVGARGAMRLFFVFAPTTAILGSYFIIFIFNYLKKLKIKNYSQIIAYAFLLIILLMPVQGSLLSLARTSYNSVKYTGPSFNDQWEQAMDWVKENTPEEAVFAHWWDYGYWVQTMGDRATILDGGNAIVYWDHLLGRHVLTGKTPEEALEFLKTHKATHLLIIVDEIGKYPAYSSIGSDEKYDRYSYLPTFTVSPDEIQETRNETLYLFKGQFVLDEDFIYNNEVFTRGQAAVLGVIVPTHQISSNQVNVNQPTAIIINNGKRFDIPLECVFYNGKEMIFDKPGIKGCLQIIPRYNTRTSQTEPLSTAIYISEKVRNTLFTQMFLFNKNWSGFELVYDDTSKGWPLVYVKNYGRIMGPIKIWKITYPSNIKENPAYLEKSYPSRALA